jgi:hypothetical protein
MRRFLLAASLWGALLHMPACTARPAPGLEGVYPTSGPDDWHAPLALRLERGGRFSYKMLCFSGDTYMVMDVEGSYAVRDNWLTLSDGGAPGLAEGCARIQRAYVVYEHGAPLLLQDLALAAAVQDGITPSAWRRNAAPRPYTRKLAEWLPAPYARFLTPVALSGSVAAVGEQVSQRILAPGEQFHTYTPVEIDLGTEHGAFEWLAVCGPDKRRQRVERVGARTSRIKWSGPVSVGMPVSVACTP